MVSTYPASDGRRLNGRGRQIGDGAQFRNWRKTRRSVRRPVCLSCAMRRQCAVSLPELRTPSDALAAINTIVQAVARGELTPDEAGRLVGLIEAFRKAAEVEDLERRIVELESAK